jgi:hypothetical protein
MRINPEDIKNEQRTQGKHSPKKPQVGKASRIIEDEDQQDHNDDPIKAKLEDHRTL